MIGLADLRQWVVVLGDAARGRVPASLVGPEQEPDDKQLDGYLLRAAILSGAAHWVRGRLLPAAESAYQAAGLDTLAGAASQARELRDASAGLPVAGLGALVDLAFSLAAIALAVALMLRLSGRRPMPWRTVGAVTLAVYLVFVVWSLASAWLTLQLGAQRVPAPGSATVGTLAASGVALLSWFASFVMPALALGRAARIVAPGFHRPFAAGVAAWIGAFLCSVAFTLSGAERAVVGFLIPAGA